MKVRSIRPGFALGEGPAVLSGNLTFSVQAGATNQAGQYPIIPGGLSSPNYKISYVPGTLAVTPTPTPQQNQGNPSQPSTNKPGQQQQK